MEECVCDKSVKFSTNRRITTYSKIGNAFTKLMMIKASTLEE